MNLKIYTDGGSLNNPGQAAYGFLIYDGKKQIYTKNERIGIASNNVAEYTALIKALEYVSEQIKNKRIKVKSLLVISDSLLMVNQVKGSYKVKSADIKPLYLKTKLLEMELQMAIEYKHVLRDRNSEADALVKEALENA